MAWRNCACADLSFLVLHISTWNFLHGFLFVPATISQAWVCSFHTKMYGNCMSTLFVCLFILFIHLFIYFMDLFTRVFMYLLLCLYLLIQSFIIYSSTPINSSIHPFIQLYFLTSCTWSDTSNKNFRVSTHENSEKYWNLFSFFPLDLFHTRVTDVSNSIC